jgi:L-ascorbate metabolism protein UlaG (beta-lactamase superfamily)
MRRLPKAERCRVTFLGHSSALITMDGLNILCDPNFSRHIFFLIRRRSRIPKIVRNLPRADLILISHGHYDHLDVPTLRRLPRETPVAAPPGLETPLRWAGLKHVVTLREWQSHRLGEVTVTAVPARHFRGRPPLFPTAGYQGYVIDGRATAYFAGDSALFEGMNAIGERWDIDVALLPIGAYQPPAFRRHHMSPEDAIEAGRRLRTQAIVPIHWGTFKLSMEPFDEPVLRLEEAARQANVASKLRILRPGQSMCVDDTPTRSGGTFRSEGQTPSGDR